MSDGDDHDLLAQYARGARDRAEAAFAALAERHLNLVYSTALRSVGNAHAAEEISQAVFLILADKAGKLSRHIVLSGWLYQTTRLTAANFLRGEIRRQKREQEAFMHSSLNEPANETWTRIAPVLDDALAQLGARDRDAIVLRFFENKSLREVGAALGASEDAAKMRVNRALEKLRKMFARRGATFSAAAIAGSISAHSVHAAPVGLAKTISAVAITKGAAAGGSTLALVKGALKLMAWSKAKTAIVAGVVVLIVVGSTTIAVHKFESKRTETIVGIGAQLAIIDHQLKIMGVQPNTTAAKAGLSQGTIIQQIDGHDTAGIPLGVCVAMIRGPVGSKIRLVLFDAANNKTNIVEFTREKFLVQAGHGQVTLPPPAH